jgi:hypothetical protein
VSGTPRRSIPAPARTRGALRITHADGTITSVPSKAARKLARQTIRTGFENGGDDQGVDDSPFQVYRPPD